MKKVLFQARSYIGELVGMPQETAADALKQLRGYPLKGSQIDRRDPSGETSSWKFGEEKPVGW